MYDQNERAFEELQEIIHLNESIIKRYLGAQINRKAIYNLILDKILRGEGCGLPFGPTYAIIAYKETNRGKLIGHAYTRKNNKVETIFRNIDFDIDFKDVLRGNEKDIYWSNFTNHKETIEDYQKSLSAQIRLVIGEPIRNFLAHKIETFEKHGVVIVFNYDKAVSVFDSLVFKGYVTAFESFEIAKEQIKDRDLAHLEVFTRIQMLAEKKDPMTTGKHIERVRNYARVLAEEMSSWDKYREQIDDEFISQIYKSAPLHDIGKVGIPDKILNKEDKLTVEEFTIMKEHTLIGREVLKDSERLKMACDIALYHHEKYNGSGYPYGLKGDAIPLSARIVSLADVFDALSTKRPYKEAMDFDTVKNMLIADSGKHFDPDVVLAFCKREKDIRKIMMKFAE